MPFPRLLITGLPETGKTTIGEHLQAVRGFEHVDMERLHDEHRLHWDAGVPAFLEWATGLPRPVVATWGFPPNDQCIGIVGEFVRAGFTLIWFDADLPAARRLYDANPRKGRAPLFDRQIDRIRSADVVRRLNPIMIETLDAVGHRPPLDVLADRLTSLARPEGIQ